MKIHSQANASIYREEIWGKKICKKESSCINKWHSHIDELKNQAQYMNHTQNKIIAHHDNVRGTGLGYVICHKKKRQNK